MNPIRVLHVLGSMCPYAAGPATAALNMAASCQPFGVQAEFFTSDWHGRPIDAGNIPVHCFAHYAGRFAYSPELRRRLRQELPTAHVCHIHGGYQHPTWAAAWEAQRAGVPYIVSLHGLLDVFFSHGWRGFRNRLLLRCGQGAVFEKAAKLHYLSEQELKRSTTARPLPAVVISNCIASRAPNPRKGVPQAHILSLSRLKDVKNVECLIRTMPLLPEPLRSRAVLKIAGSGPPDYETMLRRLAAECDPGGRCIEFVGQVSGRTKANLLEWASLLCLASHTEGQPYTVIEALAAGVPTILSPAAGMDVVAQSGAGSVVAHNAPEDFAQAIARLLTPDRYQAASRAALQLVDSKFLASITGKQWADLYASLARVRPAVQAPNRC